MQGLHKRSISNFDYLIVKITCHALEAHLHFVRDKTIGGQISARNRQQIKTWNPWRCYAVRRNIALAEANRATKYREDRIQRVKDVQRPK